MRQFTQEIMNAQTRESHPNQTVTSPAPIVGAGTTRVARSELTPLTVAGGTSADVSSVGTKPKGSFWSRHSTMINLWLDVFLLILFELQVWLFAVLHVVFPRGAGSEWTIWGATRLDWSEALLVTFCVFAVAIVLHVMLHWEWICGVVSTRILRVKARRDDGSHTLIGVGLLVVLIHIVIVGILVTKMGLVSSI
jgi:hypothetical protein